MTALRIEDATEEQIEEMHRKVKDLINYLAKYDDPKFEVFSRIKNPRSVLILVQADKKFERGSANETTMTMVGSFNHVAIAVAVRNWLIESEERAELGKEII